MPNKDKTTSCHQSNVINKRKTLRKGYIKPELIEYSSKTHFFFIYFCTNQFENHLICFELKLLIFYITSTAYTMSNSRQYAKIILIAIGKARMAPAEVGTGEVTVFEPEKKPEIK